MRSAALVLLACLLLSWAVGATAQEAAPQALVAVVSADSPLPALTRSELRLAFLGAPVSREDVRPRPVLNRSDPLLYEVFLQKVVFMSAQHYQRQLVAHVFRSGGVRPASADSEQRLVKLLRDDPERVSFMWADRAERHPGIKVVRVLWTGSVR